jgi:hypothetical protein
MVMEYFASFLCWLRCREIKADGLRHKENSLIFLEDPEILEIKT